MGKDWLFGGAAAVRLSGGAGNDVMTGGGDSDVLVFAKGFGADVVTDFIRHGSQADALDLDVTFAQTTRTQVGADTAITSGLWNTGESLTLLGILPGSSDPGACRLNRNGGIPGCRRFSFSRSRVH